MLRSGLRIPPTDVTEEEVSLLVQCLDDDGGGELSIDEIVDLFSTSSEHADGERRGPVSI